MPPWPSIMLAPVLDAAVALDRRHDEAAEEAHQADQRAPSSAACHGENGVIHHSAAPSTRRADATPPTKPSHGLRRRELRARPCAGRRACPRRTAARRSTARRAPGRRSAAGCGPRSRGSSSVSSAGTWRQAEHADHQPPLHFGDALEEALRVAAQRRDDRQQQEGVDRDEDRVEAVPLDPRPGSTASAARRRTPPPARSDRRAGSASAS